MIDAPLKILIVDDDIVDRMAIRRALQKTGFSLTIEEEANATDAIAHLTLSLHPSEQAPTWALLDYQLPDMNGLVLVQQLRQQGVQIPLIVLTGQGDEQIAVSLMKAGASDYLVKANLSAETIGQRLHNTLRIYQAEQQTAQAQAELQQTNLLLRQKNQVLEQQRQQIKQVNQKLLQANQIQSAMMQQRNDFVARLTHDLRTPLIAANRMLKFCQDETFGPVAVEAREAIANVISSNQHLLHLVNSLLDVYRHEAGEKTLTYCPCNLLDITTKVVRELGVLASEKNLVCTIVEPSSSKTRSSQEREHFQIEADPLELRRILANLIGNAIKFTDHGVVKIYLRHFQSVPSACSNIVDVADADDIGNNLALSEWVSFSVEDTGIGIAPEDQTLIFDQFRQGQTMRSGSGLGLHLAQRVAKLHGGMITVQSELGQGSTFSLYLPKSRSQRD